MTKAADLKRMSKSKKTPYSAAGVLFYSLSSKRYLFIQRDQDTYSNTWGLVGGKIEAGETPTVALYREINEEIGFIPPFLHCHTVSHYVSDDKNFEYHTYVGIVMSDFCPQLSSEHKGYAWCHMENPPKPLHPGLFKTLKVEEIKEIILKLTIDAQ